MATVFCVRGFDVDGVAKPVVTTHTLVLRLESPEAMTRHSTSLISFQHFVNTEPR